MINYIIPNSYGIGDALILLNAIFLFEKNKNRYITLTFHQRDNENINFNFLHVSDIFSYLYLKPCLINCDIKYDRSSLGIDQFGEENFKIKDFGDFYFNVVQNHILELDIEICQSRKGVSSLFYEIEEINDKKAQKRYGNNQKSITKEQYNQLKNIVKIKELYQFSGDIRSKNIFKKQLNGKEVIGKNLNIINETKKFIGSEGLWTHYSRALGVETHCINSQGRYLTSEEGTNKIYDLFESQGHFLYKTFDEFYQEVKKINE